MVPKARWKALDALEWEALKAKAEERARRAELEKVPEILEQD